jgi:hypothetical protein
MKGKCKELIGKVLLTMRELHGGMTLKNSKSATIYENILVNFDILWGGNELIYHKSNDKINRHISVPNIGYVAHV